MSTTGALVQDRQGAATYGTAFRLSLAQHADEVRACQRLRYLVFHCELHQGLTTSRDSGLDRDCFDMVCDHLMVHDARSGRLAGTYRLQTGDCAKTHFGYYAEGLFDLNPFESIRGEILELGRACIGQEYRNSTALFALWKGIACYAASRKARYLIGCSSIPSQDEEQGMALYEILREKYLVEPSLRIEPRPLCRCRVNDELTAGEAAPVPRLFRAYLDISARLCGPPAIDREFRTIDFLTLLDLNSIPPRVRARFF